MIFLILKGTLSREPLSTQGSDGPMRTRISGHRGPRASGSRWMGNGRGQGRRVSTQPLPSSCVFIPDHQLTRPLQFPLQISAAFSGQLTCAQPLLAPLTPSVCYVVCFLPWVIEGIHGPISQMGTLRYRPGSCWIPGHLTS